MGTVWWRKNYLPTDIVTTFPWVQIPKFLSLSEIILNLTSIQQFGSNPYLNFCHGSLSFFCLSYNATKIINKQFYTSVHIPCSGDFNMNRCSFNIHLGQPSVFISTWFCCHLSQQTKNTISYKKIVQSMIYADHNFHLLVSNN